MYGTNDPSDESPKDNSGAVIPQEETRSSMTRRLASGNIKELADKLDTASGTPQHTGEVSTTSVKTCKIFDVQDDTTVALPRLPVTPAPASLRTEALPGVNLPKDASRHITPLHRTKSIGLREAAFGTSDDELSEINSPHEPSKPHALDDSKTNPVAHFAQKADSDDDLPSTPTRPPTRRTQKRLIVVSDDEDEIEEVVPASKISSSVLSRRRSTLNMAPLIAPTSVSSAPNDIPEAGLADDPVLGSAVMASKSKKEPEAKIRQGEEPEGKSGGKSGNALTTLSRTAQLATSGRKTVGNAAENERLYDDIPEIKRERRTARVAVGANMKPR